MMFLGVIILNETLRLVFDRAGTDHLLMGIIFSLGFGGLMWYGIPQGYLIGDYLRAIMNGLSFDSAGDFIMTTGAVISQGGIWFVLDALESGLPGDLIYLAIWGITGVMYSWLAIRGAQESVHWRVRLELLRGDLLTEDQRSQLPAWGAIGGFAFVLLVGFAIFAGRGRLLRGGPDLVANIERGDELYLAGEYEQAELAYRQAIKAAPGQPGPHDSLGWVLFSLGEFEEAADEFARAMELDPGWADPYIGMAYIHLSNGNSQAAEQHFQTALNLASDPYFIAQAYYGLGSLAHQKDDLESAIAYYEQAVREDWQLAIAHMDMAIAYYAMADYARAIEHAKDIIGLSPDWGAPHALLALASYQLDQADVMNRDLEWAEDLASPDLYSQLLLADMYWELEQYSTAETVLQAASSLYPENTQVPLLLARLSALQGNFEKATALIDRQLDLDPALAEAYLTRAWVSIEMQDLPQSENALKEVLNLTPENWEAHNLRSFVYFHQGRIDEAYIEADTAIRMYAFEGSCYVHRAFAARAQGNIDSALEDAQHAVEIAPKLDMAYFILGVVQLDRGESEQGAASLRTFLELARDRAFVRDYIQQAQAVLDQMP
jgi:tetratricopeptide (TPR) repeat protein